MTCPECHAKVPEQYSFCPKCGLQVKAIQPEVAARLSEYENKKAAKNKKQPKPAAQPAPAPIPPQQQSRPAGQQQSVSAAHDPKVTQALDQALQQPTPVPTPAPAPAPAPKPEPAKVIDVPEAPKPESAPAPKPEPAPAPAPEAKPQQQPAQQITDPRQEGRWKQREREAAAKASGAAPAPAPAKKPEPAPAPKPEPEVKNPESPAKPDAKKRDAGAPGEKKYAKNQEPRWKRREREAAERKAAAAAGGAVAAAGAASAPKPEPAPAPVPKPEPVPAPAPKPEPAPAPAPKPEPAPAHAPKPAPAPAPAPKPEPAPAPAPKPEPAPAPAPKPEPAPAPAPKPSPARIPASAIKDPPPVVRETPPKKDSLIPVLCVLLALNLAGSVFVLTKLFSKKDSAPVSPDSQVAVVDTTTTTEQTTETTKATTAETTTETTAATTEKETTTAEQTTTEKETSTESTAPQPETSAGKYRREHPGVAFADNAADPFCPPNLYTKASNDDYSAMQVKTAKDRLAALPVKWRVAGYPVYENEPDDNGTTDSCYRYITDAYPVPLLGYSLPAAVDLNIHNGQKEHGSYLRSIDYYFGNHEDDRSGYVWTRDEMYQVYKEMETKITQKMGTASYYRGTGYEGCHFENNKGGSVDLLFYDNLNNNGKYMVRLTRSND